MKRKTDPPAQRAEYWRIICPDNDEIVARPRNVTEALAQLRQSRERHKAELYERDGLLGWRHYPVPEG